MDPCVILNYHASIQGIPSAESLLGTVGEYTDTLEDIIKKPVANVLTKLLATDHRFITKLGGNDCYFHVDRGANVMIDIWRFIKTMNEDYLRDKHISMIKSYIGKITNSTSLDSIVSRGNEYYAKTRVTDKPCDLNNLMLVGGSLDNNIGWFKLVSQDAYVREGKLLRNCMGTMQQYTPDRFTDIWVLKSTVSDRRGICKTHLAISVNIKSSEIEEILSVNNKPPPIRYYRNIQKFIDLINPILDLSYLMFKIDSDRCYGNSMGFEFSDAVNASRNLKAEMSENIYNSMNLVWDKGFESMLFSETFCYLSSLLIGDERKRIINTINDRILDKPFIPIETPCIPMQNEIDYNPLLKYVLEVLGNTDEDEMSEFIGKIAMFSTLCDPEFNLVLEKVLYGNILVEYINTLHEGNIVPGCMYDFIIPRIIDKSREDIYLENCYLSIYPVDPLRQAIFNTQEYENFRADMVLNVDFNNIRLAVAFFNDDDLPEIIDSYINTYFDSDLHRDLVLFIVPLSNIRKDKWALYAIRNIAQSNIPMEEIIQALESIENANNVADFAETLDSVLGIRYDEITDNSKYITQLTGLADRWNIKSDILHQITHEI